MGTLGRVNVTLGMAFAAALLLASQAPAGAAGVKVLRTIPFAEGSGASEKVKDECQLQTRVPEFLSKYSSDVELVEAGGAANTGRVLKLSISQVIASGGGAYSGSKMVTVEGTLLENGKAIGSFTATRHSGGGVFGGYKGTCSIVARCAKAIGRDIANWLENPEDGARLGDA